MSRNSSESGQSTGGGPDLPESLIERFEAAWNAGGRPPIDDFLPPGEHRFDVLVELVHIEMERRLKRAEPARAEEYFQRYPELLADTAAAIDLVLAEHRLRRRRERELRARSLLERFPSLAPQLAAALPDLERNEKTLPADAGATSSSSDPARHAGQETVAHAVGEPTSGGRRFRVLRSHARGGLGEVSVAYDEELHREVALKEIRADLSSDSECRGRFLVEAEITAGLEHPSIVPVYGLGTFEDGRPFYVMRFIRGENLDEAIRRFHDDPANKADCRQRARQLRKLLKRFIDVCNAIDYAHSRGVLHRDLKPRNIMLGKYGETLLVDWGVAKATGHREIRSDVSEATVRPHATGDSTPTQVGMAVGTPAFMSPEQASGKIAELGPATDVFGLGATLYMLLTGQPPQSGTDRAELMLRAQRGEFRRPRQVDPTVPSALDAICLRAMALRPFDRYPSAGALAEDVERWLGDEPVRAYCEGMSERLLRWTRRNRAAAVSSIAATVLIALVSVAGALFAGYYAVEADTAKKTAQSAQQVAEEQTQRAEDALKLAKAATKRAEDSLAELKTEKLLNRTQAEAFDAVKKEWTQRSEAGEQRADTQTYANAILEALNALNEREHRNCENSLRACPRELAGWEHQYLQARLRREMTTLLGHRDSVRCLAFSPKGQWLASGGADRMVLLWDLNSGKSRLLKGPPSPVNSLAFDPNGSRLLAVVGDEVRLWNVPDGQEIALPGPMGRAAAAAFSPDGGKILAVGPDRTLRAWDIAGGEQVIERGLSGDVSRLCVSMRGNRFALANSSSLMDSGGDDLRQILGKVSQPSLKIWEWTGTAGAPRAAEAVPGIQSLAFDPEGKWLLATTPTAGPVLFDVATGKRGPTLEGTTAGTAGAAWSPDGKWIALAGHDGRVQLCDAASHRRECAFHGYESAANCVAFGPDSHHLAAGGNDGTVRIWAYPAPANIVPWPSHKGKVNVVAICPRGKNVASGGDDGTLCVRNLEDGKPVFPPLKAHTPLRVTGLAYSPDGGTLVSVGLDNSIVLWDAKTGAKRGVYSFHQQGVAAVAFHPQGKFFATASGTDGTIALWTTTSDKALATLKHSGPVSHVGFTEDRLLAVDASGAVVAWDLGPDPAKKPPEKVDWPAVEPVAAVSAVAIHSDWVARAAGKAVVVWRSKGKLHRKWSTSEAVVGMAFSRNGNRLITLGENKDLIVWDPKTGVRLLVLPNSAGAACADLSERWLVCGGNADGTVRAWDAASAEPRP